MSKKHLSNDIRSWTTKDAAELYNIRGWANGYFRVGQNGNIEVCPEGDGGPHVDLFELVEDLKRRGLQLPILIRFSDILNSRIQQIVRSFSDAIRSYEYKGKYRGVYPIKVNQQAHVVEELVRFGEPFGLGLEVGSKPELLAAGIEEALTTTIAGLCVAIPALLVASFLTSRVRKHTIAMDEKLASVIELIAQPEPLPPSANQKESHAA